VTEEDAKDQLLERIVWTRDMLRQELLRAARVSRVDDDAPGSLWVDTGLEPDGPFAVTRFDVTPMSDEEWNLRIARCIELLRERGLKVEHFRQYFSRTAVFKHRIVVRYEYRGCIQE
jgi:hypothetical protein